MSRYVPARLYISFGIVALALGGFSCWLALSLGLSRMTAFGPSFLFFLTGSLLIGLATRPAIKVSDSHLEIGKRIIPWQDIRAVDRTGWISPLIVKLSLYDDETVRLIYPGEIECCKHLLRTLRQMAIGAMIDGVPYRQYWGELLGVGESAEQGDGAPRYRVLRPEDEEEVERLYFLLKTVGHIDPRNSGDER